VRENGALSRERRSGVDQATAPGDQPSAGEARPTEDGTQRPIFFEIWVFFTVVPGSYYRLTYEKEAKKPVTSEYHNRSQITDHRKEKKIKTKDQVIPFSRLL